jgi:hypothetical protein
MKRENIHKDIAGAVTTLLQMARESCYNKIPDNCSFIISEIKHTEENFHEQRKKRKIENDKKTPKSLDEMVFILEQLYPNLHDVNLYIYKADKKSTIIEIQYYPRTSLDIEYQKEIEGQASMLHCKIANPPYSKKEKKFDINWEHETLNHKWKMFWWNREVRQRLRKRGIYP